MRQPRQRCEAIPCPECRHRLSKVLDVRQVGDASSQRRRRQCLKCAHRYTTYERIAADPELRLSPVTQAPASAHTLIVADAADLADGIYWWRKDGTATWELAQVLHCEGRFVARFFNGAHIIERPWGDWLRVELSPPGAVPGAQAAQELK